MHQNFLYDLITRNLLSQRKNMNHEKHVIPEKVFTYANLLSKYLRNRPGIINKVTYTVYKEWLGCALMNEIKENNYNVNVLRKENITCLWVLENNFVSMIADDSNFSWSWDWLHWKAYLLSFPCIWRTSKSKVVHVLCVNLKARLSGTPNWKQTWDVINGIVSMIVDDSDFSWPWDWLRWKFYLLSFLCIWRTSKSEVIRCNTPCYEHVNLRH
jgi:hypothetical protein